jgi:hypothetical protein
MKKMKKFLALAISTVMMFGVMTGCGSTNEEPVDTQQEEVTDTADQADEAVTIEDVQAAYDELVENVATVNDAYTNSDVEQKDEVVEALSQAQDLIDQTGEDALTEDQFESDQDLQDFYENVSSLNEVLATALEDDADADAETTDAETADADAEEDAFTQLQDNYTALVDAYNTVDEAYTNGKIEQSDDLDKAIADTKDLMDQIGEEPSQDAFASDDEINATNDTVVELLDTLSAAADSANTAQ